LTGETTVSSSPKIEPEPALIRSRPDDRRIRLATRRSYRRPSPRRLRPDPKPRRSIQNQNRRLPGT
jgi:hypothetical protein